MSTVDRVADAVVIGGGHNGLVAAAYLARAGLDVVVCERRSVIGGAAVTEELAPGFHVSTASYSLSLLRPDVHRDLELVRHGLVVMPKDPQNFVPLRDGRHVFVWRDAARTREELARIDRHDADGYAEWCAFWAEAVRVLRPLVEDEEPPRLADVERAIPSEIWKLAVAGSAADTVRRFFDAPELQGLFASQGIIGTAASVEAPGTAWVMAFHALGGELAGADGTWAYVEGGMGSVSRALASAGREVGAMILTDAPVSQVMVEAGRATGVRLAGGGIVRAGVVLSNADPKTTFATLTPGDALDPEFRARVESWATPGSVIKVNLALAELPDFVASSGTDPGPQHRGTVTIAPSLEYLDDAFTASRGTEPSPEPFMEVFMQSAVDPTLAPEGKHVLSAFAQYAPSEPGPDSRAVAGEAVLSTLAAYAPNLRDAIVAMDVLDPPELEARFGLSGGNIFHGELLPEQSFGERFAYRTPLAGLYLCGSGASPGGCVMGAAGRNAARVVLADVRAARA